MSIKHPDTVNPQFEYVFPIREIYQKRSIQFDPDRVFLRIQKESHGDGGEGGNYNLILYYKSKNDNNPPKAICILHFNLIGNSVIGRQFQGINTPKAKDFFHTLKITEYMRDALLDWCRKSGYIYSFDIDTTGIEDATDMARERYAKILR